MKIRPAGMADIELLSKMNVDIQQMHVEVYPDHFAVPEDDRFAVSFFEWYLEKPDVFTYILEDDAPQGYLVARVMHRDANPYQLARDFLYIDQLSVNPESRGKGYGKALMAKAEELAREQGLSRILLDSWAFNTGAHGFFEHLDYETFNIRMWKDLG